MSLKHESEKTLSRPIYALLNSDALRHNLQRVREIMPEAKVWAVVKANAYGHGLAMAPLGLAEADGLALLDLAEAAVLREQGWSKPILLLEGLFHEEDIFLSLIHI